MAAYRSLTVLALALAAACARSVVPSPPPYGPIPGDTVARYRIEVAGRSVGYLEQLSFPVEGMRRYFAVLDENGHDVGFVTDAGLAYRYEPHRPEPVHVATDTMEGNLRAVLRIAAPVSLVPLDPPSTAPAAAPVPPR
jgi:hypothetical protein